MTPVSRLVAGAHLYGTETPASDTDIKSVFIPPARDILMQTCQDVVVHGREKAKGERNNADDLDETGFALHRFLDFLGQGQIIALDMVFTPPAFWREPPHPVWHRIIGSRLSLIGLNAASFLGYCRTHAERHGARGARLSELNQLIEAIEEAITTHGRAARLKEIDEEIRCYLRDGRHAHTELIFIEQPGCDVPLAHLSCAGRKIPFTSKLGDALAVLGRAADSYGARAKASTQGMDWKGLSHAVRVGYQIRELLSTGSITFPRPEAAYLRDIKLSHLRAEPVGEEIESLMTEVEALARTTTMLNAESDAALRESIICDVYRETISARPRTGG